MALLTTTITLGWYGIEGQSCTSLSLPSLLGTYDVNGNFVQGTSGFSEEEADRVKVMSLTPDGGMDVWMLSRERDYRHTMPVIITMDTLDCGRMYWWDAGLGLPAQGLNVPHWVPAGLGVDVGRIVA